MMLPEAVRICGYEPCCQPDFKRLNLEWIESKFGVESLDELILSDPETFILKPGGYIYLAKWHDEIVGSCALIRHEERGFELSKMAVTAQYQGLKIGRKLAETAILKVQSLGEPQLFLETNTELKAAIRLYKKLGFKEEPFPDGQSEHYRRADTFMVLRF